MTSNAVAGVLTRREHTHTPKRLCGDGDRDQIDVAKAEEYQGLPVTPEAGKRQGRNLLEPSEGARPGPFPDFGLIASRTVVL